MTKLNENYKEIVEEIDLKYPNGINASNITCAVAYTLYLVRTEFVWENIKIQKNITCYLLNLFNHPYNDIIPNMIDVLIDINTNKRRVGHTWLQKLFLRQHQSRQFF